MGHGNLYKKVRVAESHDHKGVDVDYDTTFQEQPEERRHPCRICLQYYAIGCMTCNPPYRTGHVRSHGICKICRSEYNEEREKSPKVQARRKKYDVARRKTPERKSYMKTSNTRCRYKKKLSKLYAELLEYCVC